MNRKVTLIWSKVDLYFYFLLIPFLRPVGFDIYSVTYKSFFTGWLFIAAITIVLQFLFQILIQRVRYKKCIFFMVAYYFTFWIITFFSQGGIGVGLQKLFVAPVFCFACL